MEDLIRAIQFILLAGVVFILMMLGEAWYMKRKTGDSHYDFRETLANIVTGASYKVMDGIAIALFITACYDFVYQHGLQWNPAPGIGVFLLLFLLTDALFYVQHRIAHSVRWFWGTHAVHHSSTRMNLSTALRQNFTNALSGNWIFWWLPLALIGFDRNWTLIAIETNLFYQFFLHTGMINRLGGFEKIFNTPSHHRVHHGRNPTQIDTNFGGVLIIWDRLAGTFVDESHAGSIVYGVSNMPRKPLNPWHLQTHEYADMFRDVIRHRDPRILIRHPGWVNERYGADTNRITRPSAADAPAPTS
jgi:sterol desaturase/sphingolipid hydroxylase (fatty acid hydroxylase superfamily)